MKKYIFLLPLIIIIPFTLFVLSKYIPVLGVGVIVAVSVIYSEHLWKMANDESYKTKRIKWLKTPAMKRKDSFGISNSTRFEYLLIILILALILAIVFLFAALFYDFNNFNNFGEIPQDKLNGLYILSAIIIALSGLILIIFRALSKHENPKIILEFIMGTICVLLFYVIIAGLAEFIMS